MRRFADQDLAGAGRLLEPRRDVDCIAGGELLRGDGVAGDDLAGVDPSPHFDANAVVLLELGVQLNERSSHVDGGADGSERIVLVQRRQSEHGHDRVADELLDGAAVALERALHRIEVARHHSAEQLGIEPLAEARRPDDIAEDDRHDLPHLGHGRSVGRPHG